MIKKISHVGIATHSIAVLSEFYKALGLEVESTEIVEDQKVQVALMQVGESSIELIEATEADSVVARFLEKRGEGVHHIAIEVDDLQDHLDRLKEKSVKLIDASPRRGAQGRLIAFIHPESTGGVLVELMQSLPGTEA